MAKEKKKKIKRVEPLGSNPNGSLHKIEKLS